jgi:hypothetical protein
MIMISLRRFYEETANSIMRSDDWPIPVRKLLYGTAPWQHFWTVHLAVHIDIEID